MPGTLFHIALYQPEIPSNTGNIGRSCVALGCVLHLIHPLGFDVSEKACRRAGLDYWPRLRVLEHRDWGVYRRATPGARRWLFSTRADRSIFDADLRPGDHLVFGRESSGVPPRIHEQFAGARLALPMLPGERSLNLATAVCAAAYEGLRQCLARGDLSLDAAGRVAGPAAEGGATAEALQ